MNYHAHSTRVYSFCGHVRKDRIPLWLSQIVRESKNLNLQPKLATLTMGICCLLLCYQDPEVPDIW